MNRIIHVDVFPIIKQVLPELFAYSVKAVSNDVSSIGGKIVYRLKNKFGGNWIWCNGQIITDRRIQDEEIQEFRKQLWTDELFKDVQNIFFKKGWAPSPWEQGEFAARGLFMNYHGEIQKVLDQKKQNFGKIRIERNFVLRGWAVNNEPAVSITISSNIFHTQLLHEYAASLKDTKELIGMMVVVTEKDFKGTIVEITGPLREMREWLLSRSNDEKTRKLIRSAPDDELTVKIETRTSEYIYIASMLRPIVRMGDLHNFIDDPNKVIKAIRLNPTTRYNLVREIAEIGKKYNIIADSYKSNVIPQVFLMPEDINYTPKLLVGGNHIHCINDGTIYQSLKRYGVYNRSNAYPDKQSPIKIGIINASSLKSQPAMKNFLNELKVALDQINFSIQSVEVNGERQQRVNKLTRLEFEKAINNLAPHTPDIILALFPGSAHHEEWEDDEENSMYHTFKTLTMRESIPSQVVFEDTFNNTFALDNIVLGILAKTRNIPFVLAEPLPYADIVVGIDIARRCKQRLQGSINATATARIYSNNGKFLQYVIHDAQIEGETIPGSILRTLFPKKDFNGKRVVIHRDGPFRGEEQSALKEWAKQIEAEFNLVEVIKSGAPRLYQSTTPNEVDRPVKGTIFKISITEAFLVSSPPPFRNCTPRPLQIRTEATFPIENAIHSVLSLTLLHYGSVKEPRLPVSTHYSDKIAELSLLGIKPKNLEGDLPFWL